jgi:putative ABC transport system permease protein
VNLLEITITTLRQSIKSLFRHRSYSGLVVALMALTIGANIATFSALWSVVLKPLPYAASERLATPQLRDIKRNAVTGISMPDYLDFVRLNHSFEYLGSYYTKAVTITGGTAAAEDQAMMIGSAGILKALGAPMIRGRYFTDQDDVRGARTAIISYSLWTRRFGSDPAIIGKQTILNGVPFQIVGVAAKGFDFGFQFLNNRRPIEAWITHAVDRDPLLGSPRAVVEMREARYLNLIGRLKPGATLVSAAAEFTSITKVLAKQYPDFNGRVVELNSELDHLVGSVRPIFVLLFGGTGLLLLIGCANVASLTLTRMLGRRHELWLRQSLGASRRRLLGQLLAEGVILSIAAGAVGLILAVWSINLMRVKLDALLPRAMDGGLNWQPALFALGASILAGVLFTALPAWFASSASAEERGAGRGQSESRGTQWSRRSLVMAQVAIAMILLVSAGLLMRDLSRLLRIELGFRPDGVSTFMVSLPPARYKLAAQAAFFRKFTQELAAVPGTESVAAVTPPPLGRLYVGANFQVENPGAEHGKPFTEWHIATPGYFRTLGFRQIAGRDFDGSETMENKPVAIVNETLARQWFPGRNAVGQRIRLILGNDPPFREIIGVVSDARQKNLKAPYQPAIYLPHAQFPFNSMTFYVKRPSNPMGAVEPARRILAKLDKDVLLKTPALLSDVVAETTAVQRVSTLLLTVISSLALLLCAGGLYGVVAYSTAQRRQEIAIRLALGAEPAHIRRRFVIDAALVCIVGLAAGGFGVFALRGILAQVLDEARTPDSGTLAGAVALLLAVTLIASYVPARRASGGDVVRDLRRD